MEGAWYPTVPISVTTRDLSPILIFSSACLHLTHRKGFLLPRPCGTLVFWRSGRRNNRKCWCSAQTKEYLPERLFFTHTLVNLVLRHFQCHQPQTLPQKHLPQLQCQKLDLQNQ